MAGLLVQAHHRQTLHLDPNRIGDQDFVVVAADAAKGIGIAEEDVRFMKTDLIVLEAGPRKDAGAALETEMNAITTDSWIPTYGRAIASETNENFSHETRRAIPATQPTAMAARNLTDKALLSMNRHQHPLLRRLLLPLHLSLLLLARHRHGLPPHPMHQRPRRPHQERSMKIARIDLYLRDNPAVIHGQLLQVLPSLLVPRFRPDPALSKCRNSHVLLANSGSTLLLLAIKVPQRYQSRPK